MFDVLIFAIASKLNRMQVSRGLHRLKRYWSASEEKPHNRVPAPASDLIDRCAAQTPSPWVAVASQSQATIHALLQSE